MKFYYLLAYIFTAYNSFCMRSMTSQNFYVDFRIFFKPDQTAEVQTYDYQILCESGKYTYDELMKQFNYIFLTYLPNKKEDVIRGGLLSRITNINDYKFAEHIIIHYFNKTKKDVYLNNTSSKTVNLTNGIDFIGATLIKKKEDSSNGKESVTEGKGGGSGKNCCC